MRRTIIGLLIVIAIIIFIIIRLLTGGSSAPAPKKAQLEDYAGTDTTMRMVIETPTQSPQTHRRVEIIVGNDQATLTIYRGYGGDVSKSKSYSMSEAAYADFLRGLRISGHYTDGNNSPAQRDERGYCPLGDTYVYEIVKGDGSVIQHYWSTTCGAKSFNGNAGLVQQLFENEIPDYESLTGDIQF